MKVDLVASRRHYWSHLAPVWRALPEVVRGDVYLARDFRGVDPKAQLLGPDTFPQGPVMVAAHDDLRYVANGRGILFEHGVGQSYGGLRESAFAPGYAGGVDRGKVAAFLCPNEYAAQRDRARYPWLPVHVVGYPRLPGLQAIPPPPPLDASPRPVVAFTFHWHGPLCPETRSGFGHWWDAIQALHRAGDVEVLGHAHPRLMPDVERLYERAGIEVCRQFEKVLARAHCLAFDNSSSGYEFAVVRGPVVVLDNPGHRFDVEHGLRFWDAADIGPRIGDPADLPVAVKEALRGPWPGADDVLARVFPPIEGPASHAARIVQSVVNQLPTVPESV